MVFYTVNSKAANDLVTKQKGHQQLQHCPSFLTIFQALHLVPLIPNVLPVMQYLFWNNIYRG